MAVSAEFLKTNLYSLLRFVLMKVLKLSGWHLYLALKVADILWITLIYPFIKAEIRSHQMKKRAKRKEKLYNEIKSTTTKHNFKEQFAKMWKVSRDKE